MTRMIIALRAALSDAAYFGAQLAGDTWANWRAVLLAMAGETLTSEESAAVCGLSGRQRLPQGAPKEVWAAVWAVGAGKAAPWPSMPPGWHVVMTIGLPWHQVNAVSSWC